MSSLHIPLGSSFIISNHFLSESVSVSHSRPTWATRFNHAAVMWKGDMAVAVQPGSISTLDSCETAAVENKQDMEECLMVLLSTWL